MPTQIPAGPYKTIKLNGKDIPYYLVPYDKNGKCQAPQTVLSLQEAVKDCTDLYIFSHGWNNDWDAATSAYEHFISGYMSMKVKNNLSVPADYKPVLVGIFWPSAILVHDDEQAPKFLSTNNSQSVANTQKVLTELAESVDPNQVELFYGLLQKETLDENEAKQLAELVCKSYKDDTDEVPSEKMTPEKLLLSWSVLEELLEDDPFAEMWVHGVNRTAAHTAGMPAEVVGQINPRNILRTLTVWQMKDRAGVVGREGVHPLLKALLKGTTCRTHLIGHSYGAKLLMSAVCAGELPRTVRSALLLQAAVSHLCFAENINGTKQSGGFVNALKAIELPIMATYSENDFPLTRLFHLALRRNTDRGELKSINLDKAPSDFAALGGYGPRQVGQEDKLLDRIPIKDVGDQYDLGNSKEVIGLMATRTISSHGDISNLSTWWALYNLVSWKN